MSDVSPKIFNEAFQKYNLTNEEIAIYRLMERYQSISRGNKQYISLFKKDEDPRKAKYWKAFAKFYDYYKESNVDFPFFFKAQFKMTKDRFIPNFLSSNYSYQRYKDYMKQYVDESKLKINILKNNIHKIFKAYKFINNWLEMNDLPVGNYEAFFNYSEDYAEQINPAVKFAILGYISKLFLAISKTFGALFLTLDNDVRDEIFTREELSSQRIIIIQQPKVVEYAKQKFGEDEISLNWSKKYCDREKECTDI